MPYAPTIRSLHALLAKRGLMDEKRDMIREATLGRSESARDLTPEELADLVQALSAGMPEAPRKGQPQDRTEEARQRMIRRLYAQARELGWVVPDGNGGTKVDAPRLNRWALQYGSAHVLPGRCTNDQVRDLVTQMDVMIKRTLQRH
jgi:hypothetical protein